MKDTWERKKLSDVLIIRNGEYITKKEATEGIYPVILGGKEPAYYIDKYNHIGKAIVISRSGASAGYVSFWNEPIFVTDGFIVEPTEEISYEYLYYLLKANQSALSGMQRGAAIPHVTSALINGIDVFLPPQEVRTRIASILSAYDDLIENNRKQIKLLEETAQRLYKEWFVELRFPGHESTRIVDGVPEEWRTVSLAHIAPIMTGKRDANFGTMDGKYPFFTCAQESRKAPSFSFEANAVILAGNGDFNVKLYRGKFEAYQRTYVLVPFEQQHLYILFNAVREDMRKLAAGASGSTIKFLTKGMIERILLTIPSRKLLERYNAFSIRIQEKKENLELGIACAIQARDRLLPKLMSGKIQV